MFYVSCSIFYPAHKCSVFADALTAYITFSKKKLPLVCFSSVAILFETVCLSPHLFKRELSFQSDLV